MPLKIVRDDITKMKVDAIVNAANSTLLGGGGVDGCIHRAAGRRLLAACRKLGGCETGSAKITGAYKLPCRYVIHAVGPVWRGGYYGEREKLISCYRTSLNLAREYGCRTIAFPLISSGIFGYPKDQALEIAVDTISEFLLRADSDDMTVYIVIFDRNAYRISGQLFSDVAAYIDDYYVDEHTDYAGEKKRRSRLEAALFDADSVADVYGPEAYSAPDAYKPGAYEDDESFGLPFAAAADVSESSREDDDISKAAVHDASGMDGPTEVMLSEATLSNAPTVPAPKMARMFRSAPERVRDFAGLENIINQLDESFSEMLLRKIDEKGMTDAECYKKANIDRRLFSKIRSDRLYKPSKPTVLAFAIALELSLEETKDMLMKAGFALSRSSKFDIIIEFFINRENYNIFEINEALFAFDQNLLGA